MFRSQSLKLRVPVLNMYAYFYMAVHCTYFICMQLRTRNEAIRVYLTHVSMYIAA